MSDLVKTADEIYEELRKSWKIDTEEKYDYLASSKFLVLPQGLDSLEEMLKKELRLLNDDRFSDDRDVIVSSVFARFKKEHGVDK